MPGRFWSCVKGDSQVTALPHQGSVRFDSATLIIDRTKPLTLHYGDDKDLPQQVEVVYKFQVQIMHVQINRNWGTGGRGDGGLHLL